MSADQSNNRATDAPANTPVASSGDTENKGRNREKQSSSAERETEAERSNPPQPSRFQKFMHKHFPDAKVHDRWTLVFTSVIAGSTFLYMIAAIWTLVELSKSTKATQIAADAAKKSADTAERSFQVERRRAEDQEEAICRLSTAGPAAFDNSLPVYLSNSGKVTAREIAAHLQVSLNTVPSNKTIRVLTSTDISAPELAKEKNLDRKLELPLSRQDWENIVDTKQIIVVAGTVRYENGFERTISDTHCEFWLYYRTPQDKLNPATGRGADCSRLHEVFTGIPKPQK
jgi:hypothetical protein